MIPNPAAGSRKINFRAGFDAVNNEPPAQGGGTGVWLGRSVKAVIAFGAALSLTSTLATATLCIISVYAICVLAEKNVINRIPNPIPNPFANNNDNNPYEEGEGPYQYEPVTQQPDQPQIPSSGTPACPICRDDQFDDPADPAVLLTQCTDNPHWLHTDCLSRYITSRIGEPVEDIEILGLGIICPACPNMPNALRHVLPTNVIGQFLVNPNTHILVQNFRLAGQYRLFHKNPDSPYLDRLVMKMPVCPAEDCQRRHDYVNLRDLNQLWITCQGVRAAMPNLDDSLQQCTQVYCASCEAPPHPNQTCFEVKHENNNQSLRLRELQGKLALYRNALNDDCDARPCPKCDTPIQKIDGCNQIRRSDHGYETNDPSLCNHNICFECLEDWDLASPSPNHSWYNCDNQRHRQVIYNDKIQQIESDIDAAEQAL